MVDSESFAVVKGQKSLEFPFGNLQRLLNMSKMYARYRVNKVTISYAPMEGSQSTNSITYGIMAGKVNTAVLTKVLSLKPMRAHNAGMRSTISVSQGIMAQTHCYTNTYGNDDGVAFTLYMDATSACGVLTVNYDVTFSSPLPF